MLKKTEKIKIWLTVLFQSIPVPFSLLTLIGSVISLADIGETFEKSVVVSVVAMLTMLVAGTYSVTYVVSAAKTLINEKLSFVSFLPAIHLVLSILLFYLWALSEQILL